MSHPSLPIQTIFKQIAIILLSRALSIYSTRRLNLDQREASTMKQVCVAHSVIVKMNSNRSWILSMQQICLYRTMVTAQQSLALQIQPESNRLCQIRQRACFNQHLLNSAELLDSVGEC